MVFTLNQRIRRGIIAVVSLLAVVSGGMAIWKYKQPTEIKQEAPLYKYTQQAQVDYRVFFLPNADFDEKSAGPGRGYLTPLTNYIYTQLSYSFKGAGAANINGQYKADAVVTGYVLKEVESAQGTPQREKVKVWEKITPVLGPVSFSGSNGRVEIKKEVPIYLNNYMDFAKRILEEYKSAVDIVEVSVVYNIAVNVATQGGKTTDKLNPVLVIPVKGNSFTVGGQLTDKKEGSVSNSRMVEVPGIKTARLAYAIGAVVLLVLLLLVVFLTRAKSETPLQRTMRLLLKKYGDRLVIGRNVLAAVDSYKCMILDSFEDLVKVADEAAHPIIYENEESGGYTFYVISDPLIYSFVLDENSMAANDWESETRPGFPS